MSRKRKDVLPINSIWDEYDWSSIFNSYSVETRSTDRDLIDERPKREDVERVHRFYCSADTGDRDFYALIELRDGRWAGLEAWHDYTGWDCQSGVTWIVGPSRDEVWRLGLSQEARDALESKA